MCSVVCVFKWSVGYFSAALKLKIAPFLSFNFSPPLLLIYLFLVCLFISEFLLKYVGHGGMRRVIEPWMGQLYRRG